MIQIFKLNRRWQTALCLLLMIGLAVPFGAVGAVDGQVDAGNTATAPTINGSLSEAGWNLANSAAKTTIGTPNNTVTFGALWNSTHLFVGVRVLDANLFNDSANTWEDDSVEIYIDANHNHGTVYDSFDRQFVKGYNDTGLSSIGSATGVTHPRAAITGGYSVELAIPWSNLGITPTADDDRPGRGQQRRRQRRHTRLAGRLVGDGQQLQQYLRLWSPKPAGGRRRNEYAHPHGHTYEHTGGADFHTHAYRHPHEHTHRANLHAH